MFKISRHSVLLLLLSCVCILLLLGQVSVVTLAASPQDTVTGVDLNASQDSTPDGQSSSEIDRPMVPNACPTAPSGYPDTIERTNFCVYYDSADTTLAQATTVADHVEDYWDRYVTDFGFLTPLFTSKLEVRIEDNSSCNGGTWWEWTYMYVYNGCFSSAQRIQKTTGHELFHRVQYSYDGVEVKWFKEGTARAIEDNVFNNIDNWPTALAASSSFNTEVNNYLASVNNDITSNPMRYMSALWWKYFSEQYGSVTTEPEYGVDALVAVWQAAATANDIAALNNAFSALGTGTNFNNAFRRFVVANWTKDLSGLPDDSYNYIDEEQAGNPAVYGPLDPVDGGTINVGTSASWNNQGVSRYGARYYEATPGGNCPVISASFHKDSGTDVFYHIVTQKGTLSPVFAAHREGSGTDWTQSFINDGISKIVAIIGGQANSGQVDITLSCATPVIDIKLPNNVAVAHVGPYTSPGKFLVQVLVTNGSPTGPVVAGLTNNDFRAEVNDMNALVTGGGFIQEQYWLVVQAPSGQPDNGTYDLEIILEEPGTNTLIASDTSADSIVYESDNVDHVLVFDRSGSMGWGAWPRLYAAQDAANFYVDITRNNDGLAIVPYNGDVAPAPFPMQSVNVTVRNNAKTYINGLTASGTTSIGDGLQEAVNQRTGSPTGNPYCSFVLLSDGMENSPAYWADVQASVVASGCPVTAIAFGPESNEMLMQGIATATGGLSFYNDVYVSAESIFASAATPQEVALELGDIYEYANARNENRQRIFSASGTVTVFMTTTHEVMIDDSVTEALFALDWDEYKLAYLSMSLQKPDGSIIEPGTTPYDFYDTNSDHLGWWITDPDPGLWVIRVHNNRGDTTVPYQVVVSGRSNLTLNLLLPDRIGTSFFTGNMIPIYAILSSDSPIPNVPVGALVIGPDGTQTPLQLFDDGQHGDGAAGDGFYANAFPRANQAEVVYPSGEQGPGTPQDEGGYRVQVSAMGVDFTREALGAVAVLEGEDADGDGMPDVWEDEHGVGDPNGDPDLDFLSNQDEYLSGTDPNNSDSDGGGENDGSEVYHGQDPLDPSDDQIEAPDFLHTEPQDQAVLLTYDVKGVTDMGEHTLGAYDQMYLYRATDMAGPWILQASLPLTGIYSDTADNGTTYYYRMLARDAGNHWTAVIDSGEGTTPSIDPVLPEALVIIDDGALTTTDLDVTISFAPYETEGSSGALSFDDVTEMMISNSPSLEGATWQAFTQDYPWTLGSTFPGANAHVYVRLRDVNNNESIGVLVGSILYTPEVVFLPILAR